MAWIAFAVSGIEGLMSQSDAVIGIPGDSVARYFLESQSMSGVTKMPLSQQNLQNTSITQSSGITTMRFSKRVAEIVDHSNFLWATGESNTLGYHSHKGVFKAEFLSGVIQVMPLAYHWQHHALGQVVLSRV